MKKTVISIVLLTYLSSSVYAEDEIESANDTVFEIKEPKEDKFVEFGEKEKPYIVKEKKNNWEEFGEKENKSIKKQESKMLVSDTNKNTMKIVENKFSSPIDEENDSEDDESNYYDIEELMAVNRGYSPYEMNRINNLVKQLKPNLKFYAASDTEKQLKIKEMEVKQKETQIQQYKRSDAVLLEFKPFLLSVSGILLFWGIIKGLFIGWKYYRKNNGRKSVSTKIIRPMANTRFRKSL